MTGIKMMPPPTPKSPAKNPPIQPINSNARVVKKLMVSGLGSVKGWDILKAGVCQRLGYIKSWGVSKARVFLNILGSAEGRLAAKRHLGFRGRGGAIGGKMRVFCICEGAIRVSSFLKSYFYFSRVQILSGR